VAGAAHQALAPQPRPPAGGADRALRRRRAWLPMWPRANGAYVYLPGGADGSADAPSDFFNQVQVKLEAIGLELPTWTYKYNSGANPIGFAIPREKATHSTIREILTTAYELA
jgi:hypothetical protein